MTPRNNLGAHTIAILTALEERGTCTARQVTDATGLEYETVRQYLRRCAFRGLLTVDHVGRLPVYTVSPTWRERLQPKVRPVKERPAPQTTVAKAKAQRMYLEEFRRVKRALLMQQSDAKTVADRETYAYSHPEYIELLEGLREAVRVEETLRWRLTAAQLRVEVWRSENANNRRLEGATR